MTNADYITVIRAIENVEDRERRMCEEYSRLNPAHRERREEERDLFLLATMHVRFELDRLLAK